MNRKFQQFLPTIRTLNSNQLLTKEDLLTDSFLIESIGKLAMYYAPHNEYINHLADIVIVGITPGWRQMKTAYEQLLKSLEVHSNTEQILKEVKKAASLSGSIRSNVIHMLDECGIPKIMDIKSSAALFDEKRDLLHTTSIIKYPVFYNGKNYTGSQPRIDQSKLLTTYAYELFPAELRQIKQPALVIPLGKAVEHVFHKLLQEEKLPVKHTYLLGFPHPSGANGHRIKQFNQQKESLISTILAWNSNRK